MIKEISQGKPKQFICDPCDFKCSKKCDYLRHESTTKHTNNTINKGITQKRPIPTCGNCNKTYKFMSSLCFHKKKCLLKPINVEPIIQAEKINENEICLNIIREQNIFITKLIDTNVKLHTLLIHKCVEFLH